MKKSLFVLVFCSRGRSRRARRGPVRHGLHLLRPEQDRPTTSSTGRRTSRRTSRSTSTTRKRDRSPKVASYAESAYDDISRALQLPDPQVHQPHLLRRPLGLRADEHAPELHPRGRRAPSRCPPATAWSCPSICPTRSSSSSSRTSSRTSFSSRSSSAATSSAPRPRTAPQWFMEGMASYFGNDEDNKDRMVLRDAVLSDQVPEVSQRGIQRVLRLPVRPRRLRLHRGGMGQGRRPRVRFRVPHRHRAVHRQGRQARVQHLGRGLRHQVPALPAPALSQDPDREGRADRFRRALQASRTRPRRRLSPRAFPSGDFVAAHLDVQGQGRRRRRVDAGPQALQEPDQGLHDRLRVPRRAVDRDRPAERGRHRRLARREPRRRVRPARARPRPAALERPDAAASASAIEMPELDQQFNPTFSPDGDDRRLPRAARTARPTSGPTTCQTGAFTNLTNDDAFDFGARLLARREVDLLLLGPGHQVEALPPRPQRPGHAASRSPTASGTTRTRLFRPTASGSSSRPTATGASTTSTRSTSRRARRSCTPTSSPAPSAPTVCRRQGQRREARLHRLLQAARSRVYVADSKKSVRRLASSTPTVTPVAPGTLPTYQPAIEVSVDPEKVDPEAEPQALSRGRAGPRRRQHRPDVRLEHGARLRRQPGRPPLHREPALGLDLHGLPVHLLRHRPAPPEGPSRLFDSRSYFYAQSIRRTGLSSPGRRRAQRSRAATSSAAIPSRATTASTADSATVSRATDYPVRHNQQRPARSCTSSSRARTTSLRSALTLIGDTTIYQSWGPHSGHRFALSATYAPDLDEEQDRPVERQPADRDADAGLTLDYRQYFKITKRMLIAVRRLRRGARGVTSRTSTLSAASTRCAASTTGAVIGNTVAYANFELRFPLIDYLILPIGGIRDIRGRFFLDVGGGAL